MHGQSDDDGGPLGAAQFGGFFFMITGFHGLHVSIGVVYLTIVLELRVGLYRCCGGGW